MTRIWNAAEVAARFVLGATFVYWGARKLVDAIGLGAPDAGGWTAYMERFGVPGALLPLVILTELGAGLLLIFGAYTRAAAILLAGFCILANYFFHTHFDLPPPAGHFNWIIFIKNFAVAGGLLAIAAHGAGDWSFDGLGRSRRQSK
ncbi:MAG TPA: DoxX family protein [Allosphingosinicella sp.]|jgi:putative oxidoreductase